MDCLKQFQFYISQQRTITAASGGFNFYTGEPNTPWNAKILSQFVNFQIQGFRNIDLYGVEMLGYVQSPQDGASCGIVQDYSFQIGLAGQVPQISGVITTNNYNASINNATISPSKYANKIMFAEPIKSCTSLSIGTFSAAGYGSEDPAQIRLNLEIQLYFYYKFEGE